jgi:hypothetical protein
MNAGMRPLSRRLTLASLALGLTGVFGCSSQGTGGDATVNDARVESDGAADGGFPRPTDAGAPADSGAGPDAAGALDATQLDATQLDAASALDAAEAPDVAPLDATAPDASAPDAAITCPDAGSKVFCTGVRIALLGTQGANSASDFQSWLRGNGQIVDRLQTSPVDTSSTASITPGLLARYDVVILDQLVRSYSSTEADALRNWIAGGGGLMSMSGYTGSGADYQRPNTLLAPLGLAYLPGLVSGPVVNFATHPVTDGLSSVTFNGGYLVSELPGASGGIDTVTATLAGAAAEIVQERGAGRIVVWGDEWVEFDSEWQAMPMISQFWVDILDWLIHRS